MAKLPLPIQALFFPTRPPETVAERHRRKFWDTEVAPHPSANFIWQSRLKWAGLGRRRQLIFSGIAGLLIIACLAAGLIIPNLRLRPSTSDGLPTGLNAPAQGSGGASPTSSQAAAGESTVNWQTLLICGGALVVGIGGLALAANLDERQRRRRSSD